ncbi:hypothetical protein Sjap_013135 [Stephania japonica]|uniref:Uncharacterized protein n=1 Tax=Stephania japonica TaxID=461633 RepID=A0AAP0NYC1_9MAGN
MGSTVKTKPDGIRFIVHFLRSCGEVAMYMFTLGRNQGRKVSFSPIVCQNIPHYTIIFIFKKTLTSRSLFSAVVPFGGRCSVDVPSGRLCSVVVPSAPSSSPLLRHRRLCSVIVASALPSPLCSAIFLCSVVIPLLSPSFSAPSLPLLYSAINRRLYSALLRSTPPLSPLLRHRHLCSTIIVSAPIRSSIVAFAPVHPVIVTSAPLRFAIDVASAPARAHRPCSALPSALLRSTLVRSFSGHRRLLRPPIFLDAAYQEDEPTLFTIEVGIEGLHASLADLTGSHITEEEEVNEHDDEFSSSSKVKLQLTQMKVTETFIIKMTDRRSGSGSGCAPPSGIGQGDRVQTLIDRGSGRGHVQNVAKIQKMREEMSQSAEEAGEDPHVDKTDLYYKDVSVDHKGRVYGLGSMGRSMGGGHPETSSSQPPPLPPPPCPPPHPSHQETPTPVTAVHTPALDANDVYQPRMYKLEDEE